MAPRRLPRKQLKRSAKNYRDNPESRAKKNAYNRKRNSTKEAIAYRVNLREPVEKRGQKVRAVRIFHTLNQED